MKYFKAREIFEKKNYHTLYHFTKSIHLFKIIKENSMYGGIAYSAMNYDLMKRLRLDSHQTTISFTRSPNMQTADDTFGRCMIAVNGGSLSDRFKLVPHRDSNLEPTTNEFEETLILPRGTDHIKGFNRYIEYVQLPTKEQNREDLSWLVSTDETTFLKEICSAITIMTSTIYDPEIKTLEDEYAMYDKFYDLLLEYFKKQNIPVRIK